MYLLFVGNEVRHSQFKNDSSRTINERPDYRVA